MPRELLEDCLLQYFDILVQLMRSYPIDLRYHKIMAPITFICLHYLLTTPESYRVLRRYQSSYLLSSGFETCIDDIGTYSERPTRVALTATILLTPVLRRRSRMFPPTAPIDCPGSQPERPVMMQYKYQDPIRHITIDLVDDIGLPYS